MEVVLTTTSGDRCVELLAALVASEQRVARVGSEALGGVDGRRVAELHVLGRVVGWQRRTTSVALAGDDQRPIAADLIDCPTIAVLHPVTAGQGKDIFQIAEYYYCEMFYIQL